MLFAGPVADFEKKQTATAEAVFGKSSAELPRACRIPSEWFSIVNASANNLKNVEKASTMCEAQRQGQPDTGKQIAGELFVDQLLFQEKADELATEVIGHPF